MKSNIQKVYSKLPKQELSAQKIELGSIDQLKSQIKECSSTNSKLLSIRSAYFKEKKSLKSFGEILQSQGKRLRELALDLDKKLKDLGVETPKEVDFYIGQGNDYEATGKDAVKITR